MRLSEWIASPPREAATARVMSVVTPALDALGAEADPRCWVLWGEEPGTRWSILSPTPAGLILAHVRVNVPQEGPRVGARLVRWTRAQVGEFTVEAQLGHRIVSATVESLVLRGADVTAGEISAFMQILYAFIDGRPQPGPGDRAGDAAGDAATSPA